MSDATSDGANPELFDKIVNLSKRRGFAFQSAEIYGGFRSTYDYGPVGVQLLRNVKEAWWRSMVQLRDDVVYLGITNPFIEDRMVRINSRSRKDEKSELSPYPGVDHVSALPTDVLVLKEGGETLVLQYGQMWRMQLYFWDSGYRAFTANVNVPSKIANSIEAAIAPPEE